MTPNVVALCGSLRRDSYNRKALAVAVRLAAEAGAEVAELDLRQLDLPLYDGDLEARGMPSNVARARELVAPADVLLIASPEYNASLSGALKNAIDWLSRAPKILPGKWAAVFGAAPGLGGTTRGQDHLRDVLASTGVLVLPKPEVFVRGAGEAFDEAGRFTDPQTHALLRELVEATLDHAARTREPVGA